MSGHTWSLTAHLHHLLTHTTGATHALVVAGLYAACVGCVWLIWEPLKPLLVRFWLGRWSYLPATGEWHRVTGHDHHGDLLDAKSQLLRRGEASQARNERRDKAVAALVMGVLGVLILRDWWTGAASFHRWFGTGPFCWTMELIGVCFAVGGIVYGSGLLLGSLAGEALYASNFQRMPGARVFDPPPAARPGPETLGDQMGHGDAGPATTDAIHDALSGNRRGEPSIIWDE